MTVLIIGANILIYPTISTQQLWCSIANADLIELNNIIILVSSLIALHKAE